MEEVEKGTHKEEVWVKLICEQLQKELDTNKYVVKPCVKLLHKISLNNFMVLDNDEVHFTDVNLKADDLEKRDMYFNVDLFIGERIKDNHIIPRIVIEAKYKDINTHDPITYSHKAELHKNLYPGLRYGLMVGNYLETHKKEENCYIPTRCVEFGDNFDFIFLFKGKGTDKKLDDDELAEFIKVIKENIKVSEELERFLVDKDKRCWYVTKDIKFGDNESTTDKKEL